MSVNVTIYLEFSDYYSEASDKTIETTEAVKNSIWSKLLGLNVFQNYILKSKLLTLHFNISVANLYIY